jgi:Phytanoyl-CoA dioxygenase (PhyH)
VVAGGPRDREWAPSRGRDLSRADGIVAEVPADAARPAARSGEGRPARFAAHDPPDHRGDAAPDHTESRVTLADVVDEGRLDRVAPERLRHRLLDRAGSVDRVRPVGRAHPREQRTLPRRQQGDRPRVVGRGGAIGSERPEEAGDEVAHPAHRSGGRPTGCPSPTSVPSRLMIKRVGKNLTVSTDDVPPESEQLERDGWTVLRAVLTPDERAELTADVEAVFASVAAERNRGDRDEMRYEMLNRSARCQRLAAHPRILAVIEPLLGDDCHVIANTAWRNPPEFPGGPWHCDAGPHVPRRADVAWDDRIPYPVFAIGAHVLLRDCTLADGPTAVVPGSHRSGRLAPFDQMMDPDLTYDGRPPAVLEAAAGDVSLFVSDAWHRGLPADGGHGRFFVQFHYGRRDLAQRIRTTEATNHLSAEAIARADGDRARTLVGLHDPFFYDG